jgi:hypothetical protein
MRTKMWVWAPLALAAVAWGVVEWPSSAASQKTAKPAAATGKSAQLELGRHLVTLGGCNDCHSPKTFSAAGPQPDLTRELSGAPGDAKLPEIPTGVLGPDKWGALCTNDLTTWAGPWGVSYGINLTPDQDTGTGSWTEQMFIQAMRTGKHLGAPSGRPILPPMPWYAIATLSDNELKAIWAYLHSLKPIHNAVPDPVPPPTPTK